MSVGWPQCPSGEMAATLVSKASAARREGSTPSLDTSERLIDLKPLMGRETWTPVRSGSKSGLWEIGREVRQRFAKPYRN